MLRPDHGRGVEDRPLGTGAAVLGRGPRGRPHEDHAAQAGADAAAPPGVEAHLAGQGARVPGPPALRNRVRVSRAGSTARTEKGRRKGGSGEWPALIITNWPARASREASRCWKVSRW